MAVKTVVGAVVVAVATAKSPYRHEYPRDAFALGSLGKSSDEVESLESDFGLSTPEKPSETKDENFGERYLDIQKISAKRLEDIARGAWKAGKKSVEQGRELVEKALEELQKKHREELDQYNEIAFNAFKKVQEDKEFFKYSDTLEAAAAPIRRLIGKALDDRTEKLLQMTLDNFDGTFEKFDETLNKHIEAEWDVVMDALNTEAAKDFFDKQHIDHGAYMEALLAEQAKNELQWDSVKDSLRKLKIQMLEWAKESTLIEDYYKLQQKKIEEFNARPEVQQMKEKADKVLSIVGKISEDEKVQRLAGQAKEAVSDIIRFFGQISRGRSVSPAVFGFFLFAFIALVARKVSATRQAKASARLNDVELSLPQVEYLSVSF